MSEVERRRQDQIEILRDELSEVRALALQTAKNTADLVEFWQTVQGGIKVLGWLGKFAKWAGGIAAGFTAVFAAYQAFLKR